MALPTDPPTWVAVLAGAVFCGGPLAVLVGAWVYQARQPNPEQAMAGQQEEDSGAAEAAQEREG